MKKQIIRLMTAMVMCAAAVLSIGCEPEPDPEPEENPDGSKTVSIPLPAEDGMIHLRVEMDGEDIFNGEVDAAMNTSQTLTIFGSGTKKLYIYYDGALSRTMDVEF